MITMSNTYHAVYVDYVVREWLKKMSNNFHISEYQIIESVTGTLTIIANTHSKYPMEDKNE